MVQGESRDDKTRPFVEKRRRRDWATQAITIFNLAGWGFAIVTAMLLSQAQPGRENFITRVLNITLPNVWNRRLLWISFIMLIAAFASCVTGFVFNMMRHRRKTDRFSKPLVVLGVISAITIAIFLMRFSVFL
jgi:uncharacterized membrane protein